MAGAPCTVASSGMGSPGCRRKRPATSATGRLPLQNPHRANDGMAFADLPKSPRPQPALPRPAPLRSRLHQAWDRAPVDQPLSFLDQRPGRANEPNHQRRHGQSLPQRRPRKPQGARTGLVTAYNFAKHLKALRGERPIRPSAMHGQTTPTPSKLTRAISFRDYTPRPAQSVPSPFSKPPSPACPDSGALAKAPAESAPATDSATDRHSSCS